ncbi:sialate O-acetylesterase [Sediminibacterium soli]|uniref:sialate O-acetylesterase n=1 Tax=Sediminibacterium soli TaxID=2698829 RepID=UPI00137B5B90|nr:sialate O-acetylesterase [Sediminibacterium soli]NCI46440.1 sialate O-acetylesterase [Sediminibacterium soli]
MRPLVFWVSLFLCLDAFSQVKLPVLISDGMVLQRDVPLTFWGWAAPGEKLTLSFQQKSYHAAADASGKWSVLLPKMKAGGPYTLSVSASNRIDIKDILVGDVWFCSGQSNMVLTMERVKEKYPDDIAAANFPEIRNFFIPTVSDAAKVHDDLPPGKWKAASPKEVLDFGAAAYFFARQIYQRQHVPIGIINASVGGTPIEAWISEQGLAGFPQELQSAARFRDTGFVNGMARAQSNMAPRSSMVTDKGLTGAIKWFDTAYQPKAWKDIIVPGYWADQGIRGLNGVVWYRKEIDLPASFDGAAAKLFLGRIVDADQAYVNGKLVGNITYQYPPRRYEVPAGVLKAGKNIIVVRVTNTAGKGGFVPDKPYYLSANGQNIDLKGAWQYKVGDVFVPGTGGGSPVIAQQNIPTGLYNTMVAPVISYQVKGFAWYQGEANSGRPEAYRKLLPALISDWRKKWNGEQLPFLFVQLPNFMEMQYLPSESQWALLREAQLLTLSVPNTAMAVTIDAGEWNDIHPLNKKEVGERLALAARKLVYGENELVGWGPLLQSATVENNRIRLHFTGTGSGLMAKDDDELHYFAVAGADKKFVWAKAVIENNTVVVWNDRIKEPTYVRYAWADNPDGANLYNKEGLPASPFRTDR